VNKAPAFQFYGKDWLSSSKITMMTPAEEGAYIRLICYCWDDIECSLPKNDAVLSKLSRLHSEWKSSSEIILSCFIDHPQKPGYLTHIRLLKELKKQSEWRKKCVNGGKASAKKRKELSSDLKGSSTNIERDPVEDNFSIAVCSLQFANKDLRSLQDNQNIKDRDINNIVPSQKKIARTDFDDSHFERFWQAYHPAGKVSKKKTLAIWRKEKLDSRLEEILSHIEKLKETQNWRKGEYIPHSTTYLNQERWKAPVVIEKKKDVPFSPLNNYIKQVLIDKKQQEKENEKLINADS
jgi:uncharacterized protein YdaU (DUF1376 family)